MYIYCIVKDETVISFSKCVFIYPIYANFAQSSKTKFVIYFLEQVLKYAFTCSNDEILESI